MLIERDNEILKAIEEYKGMTIQQIANIFFYTDNPNNDFSYLYAQRRMRIIKKHLDNMNISLYESIIPETKEKVYSFDTKYTGHHILSLNIYAALNKLGCKILYFKKELRFKDGKIKPDGLIVFRYKQDTYYFFIEVNINHYRRIKQYEELKETGEVQKWLSSGNNKPIFPAIIMMNWNQNRQSDSNDIYVCNIDLKCNTAKENIIDKLGEVKEYYEKQL